MSNELYFNNADGLIIKQPERKTKIIFVNNDGDTMGKLYWEDELKFEGNAEESAKVFIKWLKELWGV